MECCPTWLSRSLLSQSFPAFQDFCRVASSFVGVLEPGLPGVVFWGFATQNVADIPSQVSITGEVNSPTYWNGICSLPSSPGDSETSLFQKRRQSAAGDLTEYAKLYFWVSIHPCFLFICRLNLLLFIYFLDYGFIQYSHLPENGIKNLVELIGRDLTKSQIP